MCLQRAAARRVLLFQLSAVLAALAWIGSAFNVLGFGLARDATFGAVFLLWTIWSLWLGLLLWRRRPPFADRGELRAANAAHEQP